MPIACRIRRLHLSDFRTYTASEMEVGSALVALVGDNGAGKTNVLEALSLLAQGRGLRRADLADMARRSGDGSFAVAVEAEGGLGPCHLGTGVIAGETGRRNRINREPASSPIAFADHLRIVWLTPDQDGLFRAAAGERRRFLDRLVLAVDPAHAARVSALERALRARNRLLEEFAPDRHWLDAAEHEVAEIAVAVAAARRETVDRLAHLIATGRDEASVFPYPVLTLEGALEERIAAEPASAVEDWYRAELAAGRARDKAAGRTLTGPQASDLAVRHGPKDMPARLCSTGEQKALLIALVLAHARLVTAMTGMAPITLLDEVAAHLDPGRRRALIGALGALGGQVWLTGADPSLTDDLHASADCFAVTPGHIMPIVAS
ncbi:MAG TPA: DNA replication/repair protein RecF [Beijerinckiaceae bacterium]|mgnify:CR=1 FL=1|nr:DNA replication/repair protein RecF [Beijerinckiaceae bacterium]